MSDGPSPSDAVDITAETAEGAADAAADHAAAEGASESVGADDMGGSGTSITDALMHTEPRIRPADAKDELGVGDAGAHGYIGLRKFIAGLGIGDGDGESGTPALMHFATAGYHVMTGGAEPDDGDDDGGDELPATVEAGDADDGEQYDDPAVGGAPA